MNLKNLLLSGLPLVTVSVFFSAVYSAPVSADELKIERAQRGVPAKVVDQNDYYFHPNGQKIKLYRKKDIYVVRKKAGKAKSSAGAVQRFKGQFGDRVKLITKHQFGSATMLRLDNTASAKTQSKQAFDINSAMLESLSASSSELAPVFTTANGRDDLLLLPRVTVELNSSLSQVDALAALKAKYGLSVVRKLELSADVYSLEFANSNIASALQFSQVRGVMNEAFVNWAEPQFFMRPIKSEFAPNDALFNRQWNLTNKGYRGSRCDADCDAGAAWELTAGSGAAIGAGMVIAIVDDGVQLAHPDLNVNTVNQRDFVDDNSVNTCTNGQSLSDGTAGPDNNASPRATANCTLPGQGEPLAEDDHGTAVAGIAAAIGNNGVGVAGAAFGAQILPIRAISDFGEIPEVNGAPYIAFCNSIAEAMEYAAQFADVINNSWSLPINCAALDTALARVTAGTVTVGSGSKRDGSGGVGAGSPVIFASGNDATGWVKVTVPVTAGPHAYEWRLLRSDFPEDYEVGDDDTVWLDDIRWPDGSVEGFESGLSGFTNDWVFNSCNADCNPADTTSEPVWTLESNQAFIRSGSRSAKIDAFGSSDSICGNSYLHQIKDGPAGQISFWVWVSTDTSAASDKFEFLVDGEEVISYGDLAAFGFADNAVAYPANVSASNTGVVSVGASKSGDLSGVTAASLASEERVSYSQFGPALDLVAPSSDQHLGITTTDRTGADGFSSGSYTSGFGGTSAAAPVVSGVAAAMLAITPSLSAADVKTRLRNSADKIGTVSYVAGRNDYHGYGRVNMYRALRLAQNPANTGPAATAACLPQSFDYSPTADLLLPRYQPQATEFCPAQGPLAEEAEEDLCVPIKSTTGRIAVICL